MPAISRGQELLLGLLRRAGFARRVELPTRPADSRRAIDVVALDPRRRVLVVIQVWNTFTDLGSAARGFDRELAAAAEAAAGLGFADARVAGCWAVMDSRRNRALVARYPEFFAARFPGSSAAWVRALSAAGDVPALPALIWLDPRRGRIVARRAARAVTPAPSPLPSPGPSRPPDPPSSRAVARGRRR